MLTITSHSKKLNEREAMIDHDIIFPHKDPSLRPYRFQKPTVFLSARVHPGEVPSSHVLNGIINFIIQQ